MSPTLDAYGGNAKSKFLRITLLILLLGEITEPSQAWIASPNPRKLPLTSHHPSFPLFARNKLDETDMDEIHKRVREMDPEWYEQNVLQRLGQKLSRIARRQPKKKPTTVRIRQELTVDQDVIDLLDSDDDIVARKDSLPRMKEPSATRPPISTESMGVAPTRRSREVTMPSRPPAKESQDIEPQSRRKKLSSLFNKEKTPAAERRVAPTPTLGQLDEKGLKSSEWSPKAEYLEPSSDQSPTIIDRETPTLDELSSEQEEAAKMEEEQARLAAEQKAQEEAEAIRLAAEKLAAEMAAAERKAREEAEAEKLETERKLAEAELARIAAEQKAQEIAEAARLAAEQAEAEKKAREEVEAQRLAAEKKAQEEAEAARIAADQAEAEKKARQEVEAQRLAAEKKAQEEAEAARVEAEKKAKKEAEAAKIAAEKKAQEEAEAARIAAEKKSQEEAEAARIAAEQAESEKIAQMKAEAAQIAAEEKARKEAEAARRVAEEAAVEAKARKDAEAARFAAEKKAQERAEATRKEAEGQAREVEAAKIAAEKKAKEDANAARIVAEKKEQEEAKASRIAAEQAEAKRKAREAAEAAKLAAEKKAREEADALKMTTKNASEEEMAREGAEAIRESKKASIANDGSGVALYRDMQGQLKMVPMVNITKLGYSPLEVAKLERVALSIILEDNVPRPKAGVPSQWKVRNSDSESGVIFAATVEEAERIIQSDLEAMGDQRAKRRQRVQPDNLEKRSSEPTLGKDPRSSVRERRAFERREAPRNNIETGGTEKLNSGRVPLEKEVVTENGSKMGGSQKPRGVAIDDQIENGPRPRPRPESKYNQGDVDTRRRQQDRGPVTGSRDDDRIRSRAKRDDDKSRRIYDARRPLNGRSPPDSKPDPPAPQKFWPDMDTFRNLLRSEAELRLRILGSDWEKTVRQESEWRLDLYKQWLWTLHNGVGDSIVPPSRYERARRTQLSSEGKGPRRDSSKSDSETANRNKTSRDRRSR